MAKEMTLHNGNRKSQSPITVSIGDEIGWRKPVWGQHDSNGEFSKGSIKHHKNIRGVVVSINEKSFVLRDVDGSEKRYRLRDVAAIRNVTNLTTEATAQPAKEQRATEQRLEAKRASWDLMTKRSGADKVTAMYGARP